MKIIYRHGDILDAPERYIAHGCNSHGRMRTGVAKVIKERYPAAFEAYHAVYQRSGLGLGQIIPVDCDRHIVINCITQTDSSTDRGLGEHYLSYEGLLLCMFEIGRLFFNEPHPVAVAFPKIGAGEAGGDWERIAPILEISPFFQPVVYLLENQNYEG